MPAGVPRWGANTADYRRSFFSTFANAEWIFHRDNERHIRDVWRKTCCAQEECLGAIIAPLRNGLDGLCNYNPIVNRELLMTPQNNPSAPSPAYAAQFLAEEYKALREEIKSLVAENQTLERFAGGAVAAVITWLLTTKGISDNALKFASIVPLVITLIVGLRCFGIALRLGQIGAYIRTYEAWLMRGISTGSDAPPPGWETTFYKQSSKGHINPNNPSGISRILRIMEKSPFYTSAFIYWGFLFAFALCFAYLFSSGCLSDKSDKEESKHATVTVSDPSGSSSTVTVPLGFTIEVKRPGN